MLHDSDDREEVTYMGENVQQAVEQFVEDACSMKPHETMVVVIVPFSIMYAAMMEDGELHFFPYVECTTMVH